MDISKQIDLANKYKAQWHEGVTPMFTVGNIWVWHCKHGWAVATIVPGQKHNKPQYFKGIEDAMEFTRKCANNSR